MKGYAKPLHEFIEGHKLGEDICEGPPDISRGKLFDFYRKFIPLCHEQSRIISIGTVDTAIRDTFKF